MKPANRVVICEAEASTTESGLQLAQGGDEKDKKPEIGKVIAIGDGKKPVDFEIGDTIVFRKYSDNRIVVRGQEFNFIDFKDVMAVLPKA
jgi:co-chaperonin GroES (HSP10)